MGTHQDCSKPLSSAEARTEELLHHDPDLATITAAVWDLLQELEKASEFSPTQPDHGRRCAKIAVAAVVKFISDLYPDEPRLVRALFELLCGLADLDRGNAGPLLTATDLGGRPAASISNEIFKAIAAAMMTRLMEGRGMERLRAADDVARRISKLGHPSAPFKGSQVAKWRVKLTSKGSAKNRAVLEYRTVLDLTKGKDPAQAVTFLMEQMKSLYPRNFSRKGA
jgi:hypothetical protein